MPSVVDITRDPDLWFHDGSIVVVAEDTGFRVHQSLLSRASSIFSDVFKLAVPQSSETHEDGSTVEGVPTVHVSDSALDMSRMLHAIYDGSRGLLHAEDRDTRFSVVSSLMRMGHKYELKSIVKDAAFDLDSDFTTDLDTWVECCDNFEEYYSAFHRSAYMQAELFECINLVRLTGEPSGILPAAFYECCQLDLPDILNGGERRDGGVERLSPEDVATCLSIREQLLGRSAKFLVALASAKCAADCPTRDVCTQRLKTIVQIVSQDASKLLTPAALSRFTERLPMGCDIYGYTGGLCRECFGPLDDQHTVQQRETWDMLQRMFQ